MSSETISVYLAPDVATATAVKSAVLAVIALAGVYLLLFTRTRARPDEPTRIAHSIPFFGHAFKLAKDKRSFFRSTFQKNLQRPYSIFVAGQRHYVFSDLVDVAAVHKHEKDLGIKGFKTFVYTHIFGFSKKDFNIMWEVSKEAHPIDTKWLVSQGPQDAMTTRYLKFVESHFSALDAQLRNSATGVWEEDALKAVIDLEGKATVETMYGPKTLERHPRLLDDFTLIVSKGFKTLLFNVPRFLARKIYNARDGIVQTFTDLADELNEREDVSDYFRERFGFINAWGVDRKAVGQDMFRNMFASLINSLPTTYLALLHILKDPALLDDVRQELSSAGYGNLTAEELISIIPSKLPILRSVWFETLRMHNNLLTVREVSKDIALPGTQSWSLQKGNMISIPTALVHFDEQLHPQADDFHPRRFMETGQGGDGENAAKTLKPFGGGSTYCPGRIFGEKQMMGFIARILMGYEVEIKEKDWTIPPVMDFDDLWAHPHVTLRLQKKSI